MQKTELEHRFLISHECFYYESSVAASLATFPSKAMPLLSLCCSALPGKHSQFDLLKLPCLGHVSQEGVLTFERLLSALCRNLKSHKFAYKTQLNSEVKYVSFKKIINRFLSFPKHKTYYFFISACPSYGDRNYSKGQRDHENYLSACIQTMTQQLTGHGQCSLLLPQEICHADAFIPFLLTCTGGLDIHAKELKMQLEELQNIGLLTANSMVKTHDQDSVSSSKLQMENRRSLPSSSLTLPGH